VAAGMDIAAHGVQHDDLSHMTRLQQAMQIDGSVRELQRHLHIAIDSYAYPSGRFDGDTLGLVHEANVPLAVTTDPTYVIPPENRFEMPRVRVRGEWTLTQFSSAIEAALVHARVVRT
jgi:peptidoglycan/xylan/chitin deacetylase (PgdA/CDA1 family)